MFKSASGGLKLFKLRKCFSLKQRNLNWGNANKTHPLIANNFLVISDEIKHSNKPVVALESTIITHGLPYPINLETAINVENEIRNQNALPATIGNF